jgi:hypothetical protein
MSDKIVKDAAALRGRNENREAIELVLSNQALLDDITRVPALLQALYAAEAEGLSDKAKEIAQLIAQEEPDMPTIRKYLA